MYGREEEKKVSKSFVQRMWIRVADALSQELWLTIAENLQINHQGTSDIRSRVIRQLQYRRFLIILDDVEQRIDLGGWLLPSGSKSRIIVTTFITNLVPTRITSQINTLTIDRLPLDASEEILLDGIQTIDQNDKALLLGTINGLPLALELANSLARLDGHFRWLVQQIQENPVQTLEVCDPISKQDSLRAVFDAACQRLSKTDQEFFAYLSVFQPPFNVETLQAVTGWNIKDIVLALRNLQTISVLQQAEKQYTIHNLLHDYAGEIARGTFSNKVADLEVRFANYFLEIGQRAVNTWMAGDEISAITIWHENLPSIILGCRYAARHRKWDWVLDYLTHNASYAGMMQQTDLLQAWRTLLDNSDLAVLEKARATISIADGFALAKRWREVISLTEKVLQLSEVRDDDLLWLVANLLAAQAHLDRGNIHLANEIIHDPRLVQLSQRAILSPIIMLQIFFISARICRLLGDFEQALYLQQKALSLVQTDESPHANLTHAAILYERGQLYFSLKKYDDALDVFRAGSRLTEKTITSFWAHHTLMSAWSLAKLGQMDEAVQILSKIKEHISDLDTDLENMVLLVRADMNWDTGNHDTAIRLYRSAIAAFEDSELSINALLILGMRMQESGQSEETVKIYHEVMVNADKIGHIAAFVDAALLYARLIQSKDPHQAQRTYEKVARVAKAAQLYDAAAEAYRALGQAQEAEELDGLYEVRKSVYRLPIDSRVFGWMVSTFFLYTDGDQNREDAAEGF